MDLFFDIESIPGSAPWIREALLEQIEEEKLAVRAPANYKDEVKIHEYRMSEYAKLDASFDDRYRKCALSGLRGQLVCVAYAVDDDSPVHLYHEKDEAFLLECVWEGWNKARNARNNEYVKLIGHNIVGFDLRFLFQRSVILGIKPPAWIRFDAKPWDDGVFDTMTRWAGVGGRVSLADLCAALGLPAKGAEIGEDMDGSKVWDYVQAGRIADVAKYATGDVERVRQIYKRLTFAEAGPPATWS